MGWVNWSRKPDAGGERPSGVLGVEVTAGRFRAVTLRTGQSPRAVPLDDPHAELPLAISLERRVPVVGRPGLAVGRTLPHLVCHDYLPALGQPREWRTGRHVLNAEAALTLALDRFREATAVYSERGEGVVFNLPAYLSLAQVSAALKCAGKVKLRLRGTAATGLAVAALLASSTLEELRDSQIPEAADVSRRGSVALFEEEPTPTVCLFVDADEYALTGQVVVVEEAQVRLLGTAAWPRLGVRAWKERLLDALADRCIRLCRRDPRDNPVTEQALYDQLDDALDRTRHGQAVDLTVRSAHWYQNLVQQPDEFDGFCAAFVRQSVTNLREVLAASWPNDPPRAVWLTHAAARLPGLVTAVHKHMTERTAVAVLHADTPAQAAAALGGRWQAGELPRVHLDTVVPLPGRRPEPRSDRRDRPAGRRSHSDTAGPSLPLRDKL